MYSAISPGDAAAIAGALAALVAAIGGAFGIREYTVKAQAQRVEGDARLSQLLTELMRTANGRGESQLSESAAELVAQRCIEKGEQPKDIRKAVEQSAIVTYPVGMASQAVAITTIGYLGMAHENLREPAYRALLALDFVQNRPQLEAARQEALARFNPAPRGSSKQALQHVTLEVAPADVERSVELWELLGFERVEAPGALADTFTWVEREGTQIHLERNESPTVPQQGHVAIVVEDFDEAIERLAQAGFEVAPGREHWGAPRAKAAAPGGHTVELMAAAPDRRG